MSGNLKNMARQAAFGETRERVYRYVHGRLASGVPPTVREVQTAFGFRAVQTAREHLEKLVAEGRLAKRPGTARGYGLPFDVTPPSRWIPVLGRVQAGGLTAAIEDVEGHIAVDTARSAGESAESLFALRVRGESMTGAGILPDDIVVVRAQPNADSGDIVVALVGDEATVKRLRIRRKRIELHPENPAFEVIVPPREGWSILGKVIEVRRRLEK